MFFVFKRTFNYRYMFYDMNRNIVLTSLCILYGLCSQFGLVCWRNICSSELQGRYTAFYSQLSATYKHVLESVHVILTSLLEGGEVCVCSNMFIFFENLNVKSLIFCCKNMSTPHSFVSFRNLSILSSICLPLLPFFLSLFMCLYIPGFSKAQFSVFIPDAVASLVVKYNLDVKSNLFWRWKKDSSFKMLNILWMIL